MKNYLIPILAALITMSSCTSYSEWSRGTTGAYLGSMFGSLIGDIVGGHRGSDIGTLVGGAAGAAAGVASAKAEKEKRENAYDRDYNRDYDRESNRYQNRNDRHNNRHNNRHDDVYTYDNDIYYGNGHDYSYSAPTTPSAYLDVQNVVFADYNNNRVFEAGETAYITFEIRNHCDRPLHNVAPVITCDNNRVKISPTATIAKIEPGHGMRYKAAVVAQTNIRSGMATFTIGFAAGNNRVETVKNFRINVRR